MCFVRWFNVPFSKQVDENSDDDADDLISMEKLDRNSPEVWPEKSQYTTYV